MLSEAVRSYLQVRRAAGFDLRHTGILLSNFGRFADECVFRGKPSTDSNRKHPLIPIEVIQ